MSKTFSPPVGGSRFHVARSPKGSHAILHPHFCGCWSCFAIPLSQPQKRQLPRTLCAIYHEWLKNILIKIRKKVKIGE
jgi:hypothetical protein